MSAHKQQSTHGQQSTIFKNDRGVLCAVIRGVTIHSTRNPAGEAEKLIQRMATPSAKGFLVFGLGLAHHIRALAKLFPHRTIVCLEPDIHWPALLAEQGMETDALRAENILSKLIFPSEPEAPNNFMDAIQRYFQAGYQLIALESYRRAYPDAFKELDSLYQKHNSRDTINRNTLKRFGQRWVENLLSNFLTLKEQNSINPMRNAFPGFPALLLAGGPTLTSVLPLLPQLQRRMLILAVDTSYPLCRKAGLEPDFLVAVDPQYWNSKHFERVSLQHNDRPETLTDWNSKHFERVSPPSDTALLVSESSAHPRTFRLLNKQVFFSGSLFPLGAFFEQNLTARDKLGAGGSVATTAWDFLKYIGAGTIYMAGMDMGFPNRETHFRGSYFEETIAMSGNILNPAENIAYSYLISGMPEYRQSYAGETILSDSRMDLYCNWFEGQIQKDDGVKSYSMSAQSRRIPGVEVANWEQILALPDIRGEIDDRLARIRQHATEHPPTSDLTAVFYTLQDSMEEMATQCSAALAIIDNTQIPRDKMLALLDAKDKQLLSVKNRKIAGFLITDTINAISGLPAPASLQEAIERSKELYQKLLSSIQTHITVFRKARLRIKNSTPPADN